MWKYLWRKKMSENDVFDNVFVPYGFYCYKLLSVNPSKEKGFIMKVKPCGYYYHVEDVVGCCTLLKCEVWDEVKECLINDWIDEEEEIE
jgi:hypothetical protein